MKKINIITLASITTLIFTLLFMVLDSGWDFSHSNFIQAVIFALTTVICIFYSPFRKYILIAALVLLILMIITYLISTLDLSNWIGTVGFGILAIVVFSYIPQLIKRGYVEKY